MNIFYICCYTGAYKENVLKVLENLSKYPNFHIYLINQTNLTLDIFYTNYNEILVSKIGVSSARNIGIDLALKKSN
jgi:hypothetical protein